MKIKKKTFEFNHQGIKLNLLINGCFEPNLTSSIILSAAIKELKKHKNKNKKIIEIGCGCGVISSFLLKQGFFSEIDFLGISDISQKAVIVTKKNIKASNSAVNFENIEYKVGQGLQPWYGYDFDLIINDISAISDALVPISSWFLNAPNNAGIDGISNTITVLNEFTRIGKQGAVMLIPVLSLSNIETLLKKIRKLGLKYEEVAKQSWPLPVEMVQKHKNLLIELRQLKHIGFQEKFGSIIVQTSCFKVFK